MGMFLCDKPSVIDGAVYMAFQQTCDGAGETPGSEVFFLRSTDLLHVAEPGEATWETLPHGDIGLTAPGGDLRLGEEPHVLAVSDDLPGRLCSLWRMMCVVVAAAAGAIAHEGRGLNGCCWSSNALTATAAATAR